MRKILWLFVVALLAVCCQTTTAPAPQAQPVRFGATWNAVAGDLSGSLPTPTVSGIQGHAVSASAPTNGQVLQYATGSSSYVPTTLSSSPAALVASTTSTTQSGAVTIGSRAFDPSAYPTTGMVLKVWAVLQVASSSDTVTLSLVDATDATAIATLTSTSTTPQEVSTTLTVSTPGTGTIANARKLYYVTIARSGGTSSDAVTCHSCYIEVSY